MTLLITHLNLILLQSKMLYTLFTILGKTYGHHYLSNILLKKAQATLVKPLMFLINQTLTTDILSRELKTSRVKPFFKK